MKLKGVNKNKYDFTEIKEKFYRNEKEIIFKEQLSFIKNNFELYALVNEKKIDISFYNKRIFTLDKKNSLPINFQTDNVVE